MLAGPTCPARTKPCRRTGQSGVHSRQTSLVARSSTCWHRAPRSHRSRLRSAHGHARGRDSLEFVDCSLWLKWYQVGKAVIDGPVGDERSRAASATTAFDEQILILILTNSTARTCSIAVVAVASASEQRISTIGRITIIAPTLTSASRKEWISTGVVCV